jgi:hypothetical protein
MTTRVQRGGSGAILYFNNRGWTSSAEQPEEGGGAIVRGVPKHARHEDDGEAVERQERKHLQPRPLSSQTAPPWLDIPAQSTTCGGAEEAHAPEVVGRSCLGLVSAPHSSSTGTCPHPRLVSKVNTAASRQLVAPHWWVYGHGQPSTSPRATVLTRRRGMCCPPALRCSPEVPGWVSVARNRHLHCTVLELVMSW